MSACLFHLNVSKLNRDELRKLKKDLIKELAIDPTPGNAFECEKWAGRDLTLQDVYCRLKMIEEQHFREMEKSCP